MTSPSPLERLAGPGNVLAKEPPDAKEFDGLVRSGLARLKDAQNDANALHVQPVEVPEIVRNAVDAVTPAADAKGVRLETVLDPQAAPVSGDPGRLQQILWNLLSNAVKFTNRGGKVQVRLQRVNSHLEVSVSDTGVGIPPEFLPHVFERFRQADGGITRERGGLGLGLSIAKQLTEMHGGTIEAASGGVGEGATFTLKLPLMIVHPTRDKSE